VSAPHPVTNSFLMGALRKALAVRVGLPAPRWMLEIGAIILRTETELILKSRRIDPKRLREAGFVWTYPALPDAFHDLVKSHTRKPK